MKKTFFVLPINDHQPKESMKRYEIYRGDTLLYDFRACIDPDHTQYYAYLDVTRLGDPSELKLVDEEGKTITFTVASTIPELEQMPGGTLFRPEAHFTTKIGWTNDPNGLVFKNGVYHMFYQHNPVSTRWENMTWGHAVSTDLVHWKEQGDTIFPDEAGTVFSGSAIVDEKNAAGFGEGAILLFYTAAGGTSKLSAEKRFTQCVAYSLDEGKTFVKYEKNPVIPHIVGRNRDPKVQWSDELGKYTLSLFLDEHTYAVFSSDNLLSWERIFDVAMPLDRECPDFYPLPFEGSIKWVFSGANDSYIIGTIKQGVFVLEQENLSYLIKPGNSYAAQTFSGTGARRIKIPWGKVYAPGAIFRSQMGVPAETYLKRVNGIVRLGSYPVKELSLLKKSGTELDFGGNGSASINGPSDTAVDVSLEIGSDCAAFTIGCFGMQIDVDPIHRTYTHGDCTAPLTYDGKLSMRVLFDTLGLEVFADEGLVYSAMNGIADRSAGFTITSDSKTEIRLKIDFLSMN